MRARLKECIEQERYMEAASIRDRIAKLRMRDPYIRVKTRMEDAVGNERYLRAAALRDTLARITPPPIILDNEQFDFNAWRSVARKGATSRCVTHGVTVEVEAFFDAERSGVQGGKIAVFGSRIRITNCATDIVQLVGRRWKITSFVTGDEKSVEGYGVGADRRQPVLAPGDDFVYETATPVTVLGLVPVSATSTADAQPCRTSISTNAARDIAVGCIGGAFEFVSGDFGEHIWDVAIGETFLLLPA